MKDRREERTVLFELPNVIAGHLVCIEGTVQGRSFPLSAGTFVIGRQTGLDLPLPTEPGVSKMHAKIVAEGEQYVLADLESRNGTIVNGKPVQRKRLFDGDEIRICGCVLRFNQQGASDATAVSPPDAAAGFDETGGTDPESPDATVLPPPSLSHLPDPSLGVPVPPPTADWRPPSSVGDPRVSTELEPVIEHRTRSAAPWFGAGLVLVLLVGGGGWAGLRFVGDEMLGRVPSDGTATNPVATTDGGAAGTAAAVASSDGGAGAAAAVGGDGGPGAAAVDGAADAGAAINGTGSTDGTDSTADGAGTGPDGDVATDTKKPDPPKPTGGGTKTPPPPSGPSAWASVSVDRPTPVTVKMRAGGTVAQVAVSDGDRVKKGQLIVALEASGGADSEEIDELKESIASLEVIAESQPSAKEMLESEKRRLAKLTSGSKGGRVTASASGTISGLAVSTGATVSSGQTVCTIERGGGETMTMTLSRADGRRLKRGAALELELEGGGTAPGKVKSFRKRGSGFSVVIDPSGATGVKRARLP